ncbi:WD40 repeat domain-containing protein [Iningainema tapete]|uniref:WD40 repeat domain-containing protein n=1 Tax=Iningainema tapete BLCC-T55 TaxID=2748662 RepID=A0A8J6XJA7_9CYAN|nr:WD40 repeat domain-containing protein [Iningainema tapete]MBD2772519.1 WD40 repeat domain-containing protein [Iningainema tapete BLCC-T55]
MNKVPSSEENSLLPPHQGIQQNVEQSTIKGGMQSNQGNNNTQIQDNKRIVEQTIKKAQYVANTGEGNAVINITNYYYREDIKVAPVTSADTNTDDNLPCPYRGLFHFGPNDAEFFFGRDVFIEELIQATVKRNFIPVLGASGSGKSSVVLAGLIPKLQQQGCWLFTHFRPGSDPFQALAESLVPLYTSGDATVQIAQARVLAKYFHDDKVTLSGIFSHIRRQHPNHRVLLIADQFEELYTLCNDEKTRTSFLDTLLDAFQSSSGFQSPPVLIATMRADFLGNALSYPPFGDVLQNTDIKIRSMNHSELSQVIVKPAEILGITFEAGLVERILDDVEDKPGNLPLLEFALTLLWQQRTGKQITHTVYDAIDNVQGALARYADEIYDKLSATEQEQVRRIFIQLVRPGEGTEDTLRLATKAELGETSWALVTEIANARLVVTSRNSADQETVEVVHEALIRNWGKLRQWMETDRSFRAWQERLRAAMQQWDATSRDEAALLRGKPLADAQEWLQKRPEELTAEQEYIQTSLALQKKEREQQERQRQRVIAGLTSGLVGALLLAGIAGVGWWRANVAETNARIRALASSSKALSALYKERASTLEYALKYSEKLPSKEEKDALLNQQNNALINAIKAGREVQRAGWVEAGTRIQVLNTLQRAVYGGYKQIEEIKIPECFSSSLKGVVGSSPDGKKIVCTTYDGTVRLWERTTSRKLKNLKGDLDWVGDVRFSPDGKTIASGSMSDVKLWDRTTGEEIKTFKGHLSEVSSINFSPDGKTIVAGNLDGTVIVWDVMTGRELKTLKSHSGEVESVSFSPDGKTIAESSINTLTLWDILTGTELKTFTFKFRNYGFQFSPNSKVIAFADNDKTKLWDITAGREVKTLSSGNPTFSPDSKTIATTDNSERKLNPNSNSKDKFIGKGYVKLWDVSTGRELQTLQGHLSVVNNITFSPDRKTLASASSDNTVRIWDIATGKTLKILQGHLEALDVSFSPDGKTLAASNADTRTAVPYNFLIKNSVNLWDVSTGREIKTLIQGDLLTKVNSIHFSPDSKILAATYRDGTTKLWDVSTGRVLNLPREHDFRKDVNNIMFSLNSQMIASASADGTVTLQDSMNGRDIRTLKGHSNWVNDVNLSPDAKTIATASADGTVRLWDLASGREIKTLESHSGEMTSVNFSPDGKTIVTAGADDKVRLWNVSSGKELKLLSGYSHKIIRVGFADKGGKKIFAKNLDGTTELWEASTGRESDFYNGEILKTGDFSFSDDGKTIVTVNWDGIVRWRDISTSRETKTLKVSFPVAHSASFSKDGKMIAAATPQGIVLWDITTGKQLKSFKGHSDWSKNVIFSPNSKLIAAFSSDDKATDRTVQLWNIKTGEEIKTIKENFNLVNDISFSPDSKTIAFANRDSTVRLWDIATGKKILTLRGHKDNVYKVYFSPDGKTIISQGYDSLKFWDIFMDKAEVGTYDSKDYSFSYAFNLNEKTLALVNRQGLLLLNFDLDDLVRRGCNQVSDYLKTNSEVSESDKHLCDYDIIG